jgi:16S rRNA (cytidine1402-2'-O)-methyltransferase
LEKDSGIKKRGCLYVVATPLGNLEDLSVRAIKTLREADLIAAEDTRRTAILCRRYKIKTKLTSYHDHNEAAKADALFRRLADGQHVALVSDAGTPGISDPGYDLILRAIEKDIPLVPVPGPSAITAALPLSGLPATRFLFIGYLPPRREARRKALAPLAEFPDTLVLFEAPHRIRAALKDMQDILGDRRACLFREMTKMYEEILRGPLSDLLRQIEGKRVKGELTLIVQGFERTVEEDELTDALLDRLVREDMEEAGLSRQASLKKLARRYGISKSALYRRLHRFRSARTE